MGGQCNVYPIVNIEPFRVMALRFGQQGSAVHETPGLAEIAKPETALQMFAVQLPAGQVGGQGNAGRCIQLLDHGGFSLYAGLMLMPPTLAVIEALAQAAVERLPDQFRRHLADVILKVEDFPDETVMAEMELETEWDLLGLYWGRHVGMKGDVPSGALPDMIFLYRRPMLDVWAESEEPLEVLVTHVLVHEVGHHLGLSDEAMDEIESRAAGE